ncbi:MAG TPA: RecQ family ATP-dependent DNA helicase [Gammaproteobacteria bacterium]|nr:RecQ family ATP-dependent DNA helicase [Gammaproteobacteria bacterium]
MEDIHALLRNHFGYDSFRPGQAEVINHLLAGDSAAAVFPTGAGKSLCYQLPALTLPGVTLVVSPLIALMKDQIDALAARGIAARQLDSTLDAATYREVMAQVRAGQLRMLYVAPERFNNERFRAAIRDLRISLFAVDEAHCISEWGHNFRPDYLKLAGYAREFNAERVLALTATATEAVLDDIRAGFDIKPECAVRTGFYRPNLTLLTTPVDASERDARLLQWLREREPGATIIYVTAQKTAETVANALSRAGLPARAYHAGMKDDLRAEIQNWFMRNDTAIVVATIAFGMGVDKSNIRYIYHYNPPKSLENYSQEIGRAGRDGEASLCQAMICPDDLNALENFVYGDTPAASAVQGLLDDLFSRDIHFDVNLNELAFVHDIRLLVLRTLLTYLELEGYLRGGTPFYSDYQFKPRMSSAEILARFEGARRDFLAALFRQARKARTWLHIDPASTAAALNVPREKIIRALDWLHDQQMLEVKVAGVRYRYQRLQTPPDLTALAENLSQRMLQREKAEIGRLQQVLDLVNADSCQTALLAAHFAETLPQPCGHCSWCLEGRQTLPERKPRSIDNALLPRIQELLKDEDARKILREPRALTRFLCGLTSPRIARAKLTRHALFGTLEDIPFSQALDWVERELDPVAG